MRRPVGGVAAYFLKLSRDSSRNCRRPTRLSWKSAHVYFIRGPVFSGSEYRGGVRPAARVCAIITASDHPDNSNLIGKVARLGDRRGERSQRLRPARNPSR
jgi:hypothetical protein